jgi:hypothetical protein
MNSDDEQQRHKAQPPIQAFRLDNIEAAVWEKSSADGRVYHEVTVSRSYRRSDGTWGRSAATFGMRDLATMLQCADQAEKWALDRAQELARPQQATARQHEPESRAAANREEANQPVHDRMDTLAQQNRSRGIPR